MLSVVIINKNRLNYLALKIQSLLYQVNRSDLDILVVDYSDTNAVVEYCLKRNIRCVRVKGDFNLSQARNVGIRYSRCPWICISGNDTIIDRHYFAKLCGLIHTYQNQRVFLVGSFGNFVTISNSFVQEKSLEIAYKIYNLLNGGDRSISTNRMFSALQSLIVSSFSLKSCPQAAVPSQNKTTFERILRGLWKLPLINHFARFTISLVLLHYILKLSWQDDDCLATFHDFIFSDSFRRYKVVYPYSFQCFTRDMAEKAHGYDESLLGWGGEDDDLRNRAEVLGYRCVYSQLLSLHLDHRKDRSKRLLQSKNNLHIIDSRKVIDQPEWGLNCRSEEIC